MSKKNKDRYVLKAEGVYKALSKTCFENVVTMNFKFFDDFIYDGETFSEITILDFVAKSYAESCLTLLSKVDTYQFDDTHSSVNYTTYRFLPAMFCFRHYLELRLKCIYMEINFTNFETSHNLIDLYNDIKEHSLDFKVFEEPIKYVNQFENGYDEFFRYLIPKNFEYCESLSMPMHDFKKVKNYITSIETCVKNVINKLMEECSNL
ncbi:MAG: hypothetical protein IKJ19_04995 [Clostridia bacterium]|nr:hypothetical protein [Clostridia bacterium]